MTETPGQYTTTPEPPPTVATLKAECHALIEQVARRPGAIKLLTGIRNQAQIFSQYKAQRTYRSPNNRDKRNRSN